MNVIIMRLLSTENIAFLCCLPKTRICFLLHCKDIKRSSANFAVNAIILSFSNSSQHEDIFVVTFFEVNPYLFTVTYLWLTKDRLKLIYLWLTKCRFCGLANIQHSRSNFSNGSSMHNLFVCRE